MNNEKLRILHQETAKDSIQPLLTAHARRRMEQRAISAEAILAALLFGRSVHTRGAEIYLLGRKDIHRASQWQMTDLQRFEGVQVVCAQTGEIITVYRNRSFRKIKERWNHIHYASVA